MAIERISLDSRPSRLPKRPCKFCGSSAHFSYMCLRNPKVQARIKASYQKKRKPIKAKIDGKWVSTRERWFEFNPGSIFECYICGKRMTKAETTLDHVLSRSSRPDLKHVLKNLQPCCSTCQIEKGSKSLGAYILERKKRGLYVSPVAYKKAHKTFVKY